MGTFDFREAAANRRYPTTSTRIWMDEDVFFQIDALEKDLSTETDDKKVAKLESELEAASQRRDREAYTFHLRAISQRRVEDLTTESLGKFPIVRDIYGREDGLQQYKRNNFYKLIYLADHLTGITSPEGEKQEASDEETRRDLMASFLGDAPAFSREILDTVVDKLRAKGDSTRVAEQSVDFS